MTQQTEPRVHQSVAEACPHVGDGDHLYRASFGAGGLKPLCIIASSPKAAALAALKHRGGGVELVSASEQLKEARQALAKADGEPEAEGGAS